VNDTIAQNIDENLQKIADALKAIAASLNNIDRKTKG